MDGKEALGTHITHIRHEEKTHLADRSVDTMIYNKDGSARYCSLLEKLSAPSVGGFDAKPLAHRGAGLVFPASTAESDTPILLKMQAV